MESFERGPSPLPLESCMPIEHSEELSMPKLRKEQMVKLRVLPSRNLTKVCERLTDICDVTPMASMTTTPTQPDDNYTSQARCMGTITAAPNICVHPQYSRMSTVYKKKSVSKPFIPNRDASAHPTANPFIARPRKMKPEPEMTYPEISPAPRNSNEIDRSYSLCVGNLPVDVSGDEIRQHFRRISRADSVKTVRVSRDRSNISRSLAFVQFKDTVSFRVALRLNGTTLRAHTISVQRSCDSGKRIANTTISKHEPPDCR